MIMQPTKQNIPRDRIPWAMLMDIFSFVPLSDEVMISS
jgi:hypothetical protein